MDDPIVATRLRQAVAEEVRALLARRRISGVGLAARIGRSQAYVSRRLTGETAFDLDDLDRIAEVLGVDVVQLIPRAGQAATSGNTLRYSARSDRATPIVSPPAVDPPAAVKDRPTAATARPPRGPRNASTGPGNRRPAVLPRPTAA